MKINYCLLGIASLPLCLQGGPPAPVKPMAPPPPPAVVTVNSAPATTAEVRSVVFTNTFVSTNTFVATNTVIVPVPAPPKQTYVYDQKLMGGKVSLVSAEQAKAIIDRFKAVYPKMGSPRLVIYQNRELIDEKSGLKLTGRTERSESSRGKVAGEFRADPAAAVTSTNVSSVATVNASGNITISGGVQAGGGINPGKGKGSYKNEKVVNDNIYQNRDRVEVNLTQRMEIRDVERLFGRPLRMGGANLADQRVATQMVASQPVKTFVGATESEQTRREREALGKVADVVIEVLISTQDVVSTEVSGDKVYRLPDIHATAMRLKDAKVMGQASTFDIIGKPRYANWFLRNYGQGSIVNQEIVEATALALMDDMSREYVGEVAEKNEKPANK